MNTQDHLRQFPVRVIATRDAEFPALLKEIPHCPRVLYARGAQLTTAACVAIVGTRRASAVGRTIAGEFAAGCSRAGLTIVSGLAFGVDAAAHEATITAGGTAIAVLGGGVDVITPRANEKLGWALLKSGGTIVSEYPPGTPPTQGSFIARNRIISGLSRAVIVVEAPERSGTLATARFAIEQNREVFVVPGSIRDQNYKGSNALIRDGATLITCSSEVLDELGIAPQLPAQGVIPFLDETSQRIVKLLASSETPLSADEIAERLSLGASVINEKVALLAIDGVAKEHAGAYYI